MVEVTGEWIGFYTYIKDSTAVEFCERIPFRLIIERGISEFVGQAFEEERFGGVEELIVIRGVQNGDEIEFTKFYSREHVADEDGKTQSFESDNPTVVYYQGKYDEIGRNFMGGWEIIGLREDDDGVFHEDNQDGEWFMWREEDTEHFIASSRV